MRKGTRLASVLITAGVTFTVLMFSVGEGKWNPRSHGWHKAYHSHHHHCNYDKHHEKQSTESEMEKY